MNKLVCKNCGAINSVYVEEIVEYNAEVRKTIDDKLVLFCRLNRGDSVDVNIRCSFCNVIIKDDEVIEIEWN